MGLRYVDVTSRIRELSELSSANFSQKAKTIIQDIETCNEKELLDHLDAAGVIPECFGHDSTEEKLFAKYCDALLFKALLSLGLKAKVIIERADAADVYAETTKYSLVGDAKAFRLSRTAKNQKDFKVEALNQWRKKADYACLVAPLYQLPSDNSQIYSQAIRYNVTLISYTHLAFLIRNNATTTSLERLWTVGSRLHPSKDAESYHAAIISAITKTVGAKNEWEEEVEKTHERLKRVAQEQVQYWEQERTKIESLKKEEAVEELIKTLKINEKISVIRHFF